jgi:hypothetical protein
MFNTTEQNATETKRTSTAPYLYEILPNGKWAFYLDHHMLSGFSKCEGYFQLRHYHNAQAGMVGTTARSVKKRGRAFKRDIGIWWARCLEWYYTALAQGPVKQADLCDFAEASWKHENMDGLKADFPSSYEKFGGLIGAVGMIADYYNFSYQFDSAHWKIIAIESGFGRKREVKIGENSKVVLYWLGRPDLFISESGRWMPLDNKTKDYIKPSHVHEFKPHPQTTGYIVAAQEIAKEKGLDVTIDRCLINLAARNAPSDNPRNGVKRPRFQRIPISYSVAELEEWRYRTLLKATRLRHCIENDEWLWNEEACHTYGGCDYRPIHAVPPNARLIIIQSQFTITDPWVAYEPEGDD